MTQTSQEIVLGYDGSPEADLAVSWAAHAARLHHTELRVVLVATDMDPVVGHFREANDRLVEDWRVKAHYALGHADSPASPVDILRGPTGPVLVKAAKAATMLVVGSRGHGLAAGSLRGSVSQHLARHASCPVVVVRPSRDPHPRQIVVGVDGSAESHAALRFACPRARLTGERVLAIHGYPVSPMHGAGPDHPRRAHAVNRKQNAEHLLAESVAGVRSDFPDLEIATRAIPAPASHLIRDCSTAASLVVVGSRGRDAISEMLLGSVSQYALQHAECPVAVVPLARG